MLIKAFILILCRMPAWCGTNCKNISRRERRAAEKKKPACLCCCHTKRDCSFVCCNLQSKRHLKERSRTSFRRQASGQRWSGIATGDNDAKGQHHARATEIPREKNICIRFKNLYFCARFFQHSSLFVYKLVSSIHRAHLMRRTTRKEAGRTAVCRTPHCMRL